MEFKVKCPYCEELCKVEVDTASVCNGSIYKDLVECGSCDKPFILSTEIMVKLTILPIASEPVTESSFTRKRRIERLFYKKTSN